MTMDLNAMKALATPELLRVLQTLGQTVAGLALEVKEGRLTPEEATDQLRPDLIAAFEGMKN